MFPNPIRGETPTFRFGIAFPCSIHRVESRTHKSKPFSARETPMACVRQAGPRPTKRRSLPPRNRCITSIPSTGSIARSNTAAGKSCSFGHYVQHPVHSISEVNVREPWQAIHDSGPRRSPCLGVTSQIAFSNVGFSLNDEAGKPRSVPLPDQGATQELACNSSSPARVKTSGKWLRFVGGH